MFVAATVPFISISPAVSVCIVKASKGLSLLHETLDRITKASNVMKMSLIRILSFDFDKIQFLVR
jgi:hypothetical protein